MSNKGCDEMTDAKWWSLTASKQFWEFESLKAILEEKCERFVIGDEIGEGGYKHFQIKAVFKKGMSLKELNVILPGVHGAPTVTRNFEYEEKDGNFYRSWEKAISKHAVEEWNSWEQMVVSMAEQQTDRQVLVIVDLEGGIGKTKFAKKLVAKHICDYIPQMDKPKDYMRVAYAKKNAKGFFFDICRTQDYHGKFDGNWQSALWSAIEKMKDGFVYDERNSWKEAWIDSPLIIVAMNEYPRINALSKDRWIIVTIEGKAPNMYAQWHDVDEWVKTRGWGE